jgi:hypothetical protein
MQNNANYHVDLGDKTASTAQRPDLKLEHFYGRSKAFEPPKIS